MSITSDELNFLVYRYLEESGFVHSAFVFAYESLVGRSSIATADVPPGALINFLQKGLQYVEIEKELEQGGGTTNLTNGISLLSGARDIKLDSERKAGEGDVMEISSDTKNEGGMNPAESSTTSSSSAAASTSAAATTTTTSGDDKDKSNKASDDDTNKDNNTTGNVGAIIDGNKTTTLDLESKTKPSVPGADSSTVTQADVTELKGHKADVVLCAWNPTCDLLASGSADATVRLWNVPRGASGLPAGTAASKDCLVLPHDTSASSSENGGAVGTGASAASSPGAGTNSMVIDSGAGAAPAGKVDITAMDWRQDGSQLATGAFDCNARIWSLKGELKHTLSCHKGVICCTKWNKSGNYLLTGSVDTTAVVWDTATGTVLQQFEDHTAPVLDVDWQDDETFATCSTDKMIYLYKVGETSPLKRLSGHIDEVNSIKWDPSGKILASCSDDFTAKLWKTDSDQCVQTFTGHSKEINKIRWSPASQIIATASPDATIRTWDVELGKELHVLSSDHAKPVNAIAFSPDGQFLASGSMDSTLRIWNLKDGKCVKHYKGNGGIFEVAWNKEGDKVAACFGLPSKSVCVIDFRK